MLNMISWTFIGFLLLTLLVYYLIPKKFQWICLLFANCVFYACTGLVNFIFIIISAASTFFGAMLTSKMTENLNAKKASVEKDAFKTMKEKLKTKKRLALLAVLFIDIGTLCFLKYIPALAKLINGKSFSLFLPLGISFYTFQTISYFMDVHNGKYKRETNFFRYLTFVSFFPQLIQGPINRYDKLGTQINAEHSFNFENVKKGVLLFLFGAMKKFCIADMLVNRISALLDPAYTALPGFFILLGILAYAIYQYADFSGGIDMVMGVSTLFGIEMQPNFRQPYFSVSLADFWRRWHISLGLWMKDYVFFPLALTKWFQNLSKWCGKHFGKHSARFIPAGISNIIVFLLVGIWHGPELHYVVWGLYNGLVIAISDALKPAFEKLSSKLRINTEGKPFHVFRIIRTFIIVNIGWYFDRIVDVKKAFVYLARTFTDFGNPQTFLQKQYLKNVFGSLHDVESQLVLIFLATVITFIISIIRENNIDVYSAIQKKNIAFRWASYYVPLLLLILSLSFSPGNPVFMYAQF